MEYPQIDLYEFLTESELQQYYNAIKNELKITNAAQFKYATDEDLKHIGLSRPEIRRLRKFYEKHFPHGYLSKIKRLLQAPTTIVKRDDGLNAPHAAAESAAGINTAIKAGTSPAKVPNNKHIIPADCISVNKQLGTGEFGIVQQGVWTNGTMRIQVAIKCLCRERMQSNPMEFLKEAAIMHSIEHENIVRLYGVVLATDSLMLVTELAHLRSLLECLKDSGLRVNFLTIPTLCEFAKQICNGMRYLEQKRLIHRDLAARNILVFGKNKVKISDFGLSRALGVGKDYYKTNFNVNLKLPIAWCAPECINYLRFTNASDVWAFGVCLWEMFSYGFQPWAALTGLQILEAIDAPNYQRLEQPDCCPSEYYALMMKCWEDDAAKRPKFGEIYEILPDMKPEQLKAVVNCCEPKKDHLLYRQGEIITVLDRSTGTPFWKGVLNSGKTGYFNPSNTVAFLEGLPCSNRDSFSRVSDQRSSKRNLRTKTISKPDALRHTGHVGIDGESFGDIAFLAGTQNYNHVPKQIVTPYKPSEDIEQTPLLQPPTPTSPDSLQTASGYFPEGSSNLTSLNPTFVSSTENTPKQLSKSGQAFDFSGKQSTASNMSTNPFAIKDIDEQQFAFAMQNNNYGLEGAKSAIDVGWRPPSRNTTAAEYPHEYHEISDDEIAADKLDFGPSLLDEINSMFGSISSASGSNQQQQPNSPDFEHINIKNEFTEISSKLANKSCSGNSASGIGGDSNGNNKFGLSTLTSSKKKTAGTVKPISVKDERILNHAIEIANEISARSMIDLVSDHAPAAQSPKRKFSFRFPHLSNNSADKSTSGPAAAAGNITNVTQHGNASPYSKKKNFTEELKNIPDIQSIIGEEGREAYNSLIERKGSIGVSVGISPAAPLFRHLDTNEFDMTTAKTLPRRSMHLRNNGCDTPPASQPTSAASPTLNRREVLASEQAPLQHAPRPMTLPTRGSAQRCKKAELLTLNGKENNENCNSIITQDGSSAGAPLPAPSPANETMSPLESPSYMANTFYKFPEQTSTTSSPMPTPTTSAVNVEANTATADAANPIPLPPRDGKKHIKTNAKRHVRKYPLIIPANGVHRTLSKVTDFAPSANDDDDLSNGTAPGNGMQNGQLQLSTRKIEVVAAIRSNSLKAANAVAAGFHVPTTAALKRTLTTNGLLRGTSFVSASLVSPSSPSVVHDEHTYQNLEKLDVCNGDTASLQFESILEADSNKGNVLQSPDVTDGFYNFSIQKEHYHKNKEVEYDTNKISGLYVNEDEFRNLDIERSPKVTTVTATTAVTNSKDESMLASDGNESAEDGTSDKEKTERFSGSAESELAGNALFKKVRESVNLAMSKECVSDGAKSMSKSNMATVRQTVEPPSPSSPAPAKPQTEAEYFAAAATRLAEFNSVSCEDLLEFADIKPKGCERGVDSDEVRIMMKVLGKDSTPERSLHVLEFIDWDVHKAIKIIRLQNILNSVDLTLTESVKALLKYDWDLHKTAFKLKGLEL